MDGGEDDTDPWRKEVWEEPGGLVSPSHPTASLTAPLGSSAPGEDIPYPIFLIPYTCDSAGNSWAMKHRATTNKTKGIFSPENNSI